MWAGSLAVLCLLASPSAAKICDVFDVNGKQLCAPALFVPGIMKCGTNAMREYLSIHPLIKWNTQSEIDFRSFEPQELVAKYNPGVTPHDNLIWAIKVGPAHCPPQRPTVPVAARMALSPVLACLAVTRRVRHGAISPSEEVPIVARADCHL